MSRLLLSALIVTLLATPVRAATVFDQPHNGTGTLHKSSWYPPDGLDGDAYCWDNFTLATSTAVTEVRWRGGFELHPSGTGQPPVDDFEVSIYRSIAGNSQPDLGPGGRLVRYMTGGNAGETAAGAFGGVALFDYAFTLPSPFQAAAGTTYWVRIVASQTIAYPNYAPDWGLAVGTGGNNAHFRFVTGGTYQSITNDLAFSLQASGGPAVTILATASPAGAGTVSGAGSYPIGSLVSLVATPSPSHGFVDWTENGATVSTNPNYTFTAAVSRTLVARFDTSFTVVTAAQPPYGGTVTGDGTYTRGASITLTATPNHGFLFDSWSDGSLDATHIVIAEYDLWITAFFRSAPDAATFDFDAGPVSTGLPLDWTVSGLTAHFAGDFSVQPVGTVGIWPIGFTGLCLWPGSVFPSDLVIDFSETLTDLSILVATVDNACDVSSRMRVTAYLGATWVGTNTVVPPQGVYPSATLSIVAPSGFDRAVVHWDAPGSVCQDYAPIFLADNVTVTRAVPPAGVGGVGADGRPHLLAPAPNPLHDQTAVRFVLPRATDVTLAVYDPSGRLVRRLASGRQAAGPGSVAWNGTDGSGNRVSPGVYVVRFEASGWRESRSIVVIR